MTTPISSMLSKLDDPNALNAVCQKQAMESSSYPQYVEMQSHQQQLHVSVAGLTPTGSSSLPSVSTAGSSEVDILQAALHLADISEEELKAEELHTSLYPLDGVMSSEHHYMQPPAINEHQYFSPNQNRLQPEDTQMPPNAMPVTQNLSNKSPGRKRKAPVLSPNGLPRPRGRPKSPKGPRPNKPQPFISSYGGQKVMYIPVPCSGGQPQFPTPSSFAQTVASAQSTVLPHNHAMSHQDATSQHCVTHAPTASQGSVKAPSQNAIQPQSSPANSNATSDSQAPKSQSSTSVIQLKTAQQGGQMKLLNNQGQPVQLIAATAQQSTNSSQSAGGSNQQMITFQLVQNQKTGTLEFIPVGGGAGKIAPQIQIVPKPITPSPTTRHSAGASQPVLNAAARVQSSGSQGAPNATVKVKTPRQSRPRAPRGPTGAKRGRPAKSDTLRRQQQQSVNQVVGALSAMGAYIRPLVPGDSMLTSPGGGGVSQGAVSGPEMNPTYSNQQQINNPLHLITNSNISGNLSSPSSGMTDLNANSITTTSPARLPGAICSPARNKKTSDSDGTNSVDPLHLLRLFSRNSGPTLLHPPSHVSTAGPHVDGPLGSSPAPVCARMSSRGRLPGKNRSPDSKKKSKQKLEVPPHIQQAINYEQNHVLAPDYHRPFENLRDVALRLLPYHVFQDMSHNGDFLKQEDDKFAVQCERLVTRTATLYTRFQCAMLKEATRECNSSELSLLAHLSFEGEIDDLEMLKKRVNDSLHPSLESYQTFETLDQGEASSQISSLPGIVTFYRHDSVSKSGPAQGSNSIIPEQQGGHGSHSTNPHIQYAQMDYGLDPSKQTSFDDNSGQFDHSFPHTPVKYFTPPTHQSEAEQAANSILF